MITQFRTLFTVSVAHAYYSAGCRDFDFVVPADTAQLLRNGRLLAKVRDGGLHVFYEAAEDGTPLVPVAGTTLRFGLRLLNPFFSNITEFAIKTPLYRNAPVVAILAAPREVALAGPMFSHPLTVATRPVTVVLKNEAGRPLQTDTITAANDRETVSYDLTGQAAGLYVVEETYPADAEAITYYVDAELTQVGVFGVLEIGIDASFYVPATSPAFTIAFIAKTDTLKYYVVAENYTDTEFGQLSVADGGFAEEGRPPVTFAKVVAAAFTAEEIPPGMLGESGAQVVLFKSQAPVARQEKARKKIQLSRNGDVLIKHLPQLGAEKARGDVIVHLSKP